MAKVKTQFAIVRLLDKVLDKKTADQIGNSIIDGIKDSVSKGLSPVRGEGRFKKYAMLRDNDPRKYPAYEKGKNVNPVNLKLTGELLDNLTHRVEKKGKAEALIVGIDKNASERVKAIAEAHNDGTLERNNVPKRKFIPNENGQKFITSIERKLVSLYEKRINDIIKKSNKS